MKRNNYGFTLVELIIVIAILGIIAMIVLPNVPKIIQRQRVKADIITAQQIGSMVRMWYTDEKYNDVEREIEEGKKTIDDLENSIPSGNQVVPIKYSELQGIEMHIDGVKKPTSLFIDGEEANEPYFGVYLTTTGQVAKIVVTIQDVDEDGNSTALLFGEGEGKIDSNKVAYDGTKPGIAYIE